MSFVDFSVSMATAWVSQLHSAKPSFHTSARIQIQVLMVVHQARLPTEPPTLLLRHSFVGSPGWSQAPCF